VAEFEPDLFRRMQEAALRFRSGESDREEIMTPNGPAVLIRDPTNALGFRIDFVGGGASHSVSEQTYPAARRPHGWPAPLPFLANCRATINTLDQAVTWHDVAEIDACVASVRDQCVADGWLREPEADDGPASYAFTKEGVRRVLTVSRDDGTLTLHERRPSRPKLNVVRPSGA
jgi:hypothetical protein